VPRLVLVADGSPSHQRRAQGILTGEGLEVITVSNGVAAIKKLPAAKVSLVLADVSMPGRDGYEVCEFVKNSPDLSRIPVLLSYSDQTPYDESRAQRAKADGRIKKPFGQDELLSTVKRFLLPEEAAPPPPPVRAPAVAAPAPIEAPEPMDLPAEEPAKAEVPDLSSLSDSALFAEQPVAEEAPEMNPPPMALDEMFSRAAGETPAPEAESPAMAFGGFPESAAPPVEEPAPPAEPLLVEEPAVEAPPEEEEEPAARTMMFRMPVQLAEPILADDSSAEPPVEEPPPAPVEEPAPAPVGQEIAAATLDSYSLADAASGQVSLTAPPEEAPAPPPVEEPAPAAVEPSAEAAPAPEAEAGTSAAAVLDTDLVHWIVHNVVVRMAPPALSTVQVEELIREITDEMINDLTQPPPES
jgi:CheY-like chemotaxis protein